MRILTIFVGQESNLGNPLHIYFQATHPPSECNRMTDLMGVGHARQYH